MRHDYASRELEEKTADGDPFAQFVKWFDEAIAARALEPNAMTLSTADTTGAPSSRVVLLKGFDTRGFVFFTNYESQKGTELSQNPRAALHFFWPELERQVNIRGSAERTSVEESAAYFSSRPAGSRIGAWASRQSRAITSRTELEARVDELKREFGDGEIPLPPFWGGFRIIPTRFEFWQGRSNRLHDRICYLPDRKGAWHITRLSP